MSEPIIQCDVAGAVATITINRPEKLNALDGATVRALHEALDRVACFDTADQREGMTAFLEKRAAKFEGR